MIKYHVQKYCKERLPCSRTTKQRACKRIEEKKKKTDKTKQNIVLQIFKKHDNAVQAYAATNTIMHLGLQ